MTSELSGSCQSQLQGVKAMSSCAEFFISIGPQEMNTGIDLKVTV